MTAAFYERGDDGGSGGGSGGSTKIPVDEQINGLAYTTSKNCSCVTAEHLIAYSLVSVLWKWGDTFFSLWLGVITVL